MVRIRAGYTLASGSKAFFDNPVGVTQWTCPSAPIDGWTHHITGGSHCRYCKLPLKELRKQQAEAK